MSQMRKFTLMPPAPDVCQTCATDHAPELPHNATSLYYQMAFHQEHGRWPSWQDAAAHCDDEVSAVWRATLEELGHSWTEPAKG